MKHWRKTVTLLASAGLLGDVDILALEQYCSLYARWYEAEADVEAEGPVLILKNGIKQVNPSLKIAVQCQSQMKFYLDRFGLTPGARAKLKVEEPEKDDEGWSIFDANAG